MSGHPVDGGSGNGEVAHLRQRSLAALAEALDHTLASAEMVHLS